MLCDRKIAHICFKNTFLELLPHSFHYVAMETVPTGASCKRDSPVKTTQCPLFIWIPRRSPGTLGMTQMPCPITCSDVPSTDCLLMSAGPLRAALVTSPEQHACLFLFALIHWCGVNVLSVVCYAGLCSCQVKFVTKE
ncbi:hypothetical protein WMY93_018729 [Mugilogobius chulae]|uniref:Uncharacterized protein n=1 Tax=Mugilogobius chulae TaxID=88201 RepID=A0AAW0NPN4_9GOBI